MWECEQVGDECGRICKKSWMKGHGKGKEETDAWLDGIKEDRYVVDAFE
jgi:hypothetical protein